mmetsp:Transcript_36670/g.72553  ORF Transcript_36670/g.72553 Transcript_36670/m.72553 type:complete len:108 (-) Transcript_36670:41-364(-)
MQIGKSLDVFVCIRLAGIVQEYLCYGQARTGLYNIQAVQTLFRSVKFEERRKRDETRWAVLNVASLLQRHKEVCKDLVKAMENGLPTAQCLALIESRIAGKDEDEAS